MASSFIAGATGVGKSAYDRAELLRAAHATARSRRANNRAWRSYRQAFADALRSEWRKAKEVAAVAAFDAAEAALPPIPADIAARASAMRADAWFAPVTADGTARMVAAFAAAEAMLAPYRLSC